MKIKNFTFSLNENLILFCAINLQVYIYSCGKKRISLLFSFSWNYLKWFLNWFLGETGFNGRIGEEGKMSFIFINFNKKLSSILYLKVSQRPYNKMVNFKMSLNDSNSKWKEKKNIFYDLHSVIIHYHSVTYVCFASKYSL